MPRYAATLLILLALACTPALAAVNNTGDVRPVAPGGFGLPIGANGIDDDGDNIADWIDSQGNNVFDNLADPNNPLGGNGLNWDNELIWVDYETTQNILIGETGYGLLEINGGSALRYQHLVLGGSAEDTNGNLELTTTDGEDYDFLQDLRDQDNSRTGVGVMTITGVGSVFNNDPNVIPGEFQTALNFADPSADVGDQVNTTPDPTARVDDEGFDVHVGLLGSGQLNVLAGGRIEIQDALLVGTASTAQGDVTVDGFGSYLAAYGRTEFQPGTGTPSMPTTVTASIVGGNGRGSLTVSEGGRADFFNGLSIGAGNGSPTAANIASEDVGTTDPLSSGVVTVTGNGSSLTIDSTTLIRNGAALAIGELRGDPTATLRYDNGGAVINAPDGTQTLGDGLLRIETGSNVTVIGSGSAEVGFNGVLELRGGRINVGGDLVNDGRIDGVGDVLATTLNTSVYSTIRGGDPDAQPGNPSSEPLRIVLAGNGGGGGIAFTNLGLVDGLVDLSVTGDLSNLGRIEVGGEIKARAIITTVGSSLIGNAATGSPLRIRLDSQDQVDEANPALQNNGLIGGDIDLITPGGVVNGGNLIDEPNSSNGGVIRANGVIQVGTFINHGLGEIHVEQGKSLSILAVGVPPVATLPGVVLEDGIDQRTSGGTDAPDGEAGNADFYVANLGKIIVNGGTFESGWVTDNRPDIEDGAINHVRLFRNARHVEVDAASTSAAPVGDETVGTITSIDGTLLFRDGLYNTGVVSFAGGANVVRGQVINAGFFRDTPDRNGIDYDPGTEEYLRPGVILVSGDNTSVTFQDSVRNSGIISIGPNGNVANFLGDLDNTGGTIQIALSPFAADVVSAYITVGGEVRINGGSIVLNGGGGTVDPTSVSSFAFATAPGEIALAGEPLVPGEFSLTVLEADGELSEDSLFTSLVLPETGEGVYWDIVYDTDADEIRIELIESDAIGADFNNDNIVDQLDIDIWTRNVGIVSGASIIQGDADLDGDVDLGDYEQLMQQIFAGGTPIAFAAAVPEPAALMLLCVAGVAAAARRRG
ncbi:hypothetical protein MalM25_01240 [Planctomycetes bacterium MalM25]|nr:hypothetical protein MalM25_01240 [Planctomycetes bacterium MalM25]